MVFAWFHIDTFFLSCSFMMWFEKIYITIMYIKCYNHFSVWSWYNYLAFEKQILLQFFQRVRPLYGFKRKNYMIQWSAMYHTINMFYTKSVKHNRIVYDQLIVNWFRISAMFFNGCQTLYEKNCNWRTSNILVFTLCLNVFMFW